MGTKRAHDVFTRDGLQCEDPSLTVVSAQDETDINSIVRRFGLTGELPKDVRMPTFEDYEQVYDFHSAMNMVAEAKEAFMKMPADVRTRFQNDPNDFLYFVMDDRNRAEAKRLGLLMPEVADVVPAAPVAPPAGPVVT